MDDRRTTTARQLHYEQKSAGYQSSSARDSRILELVGGPGLRVLDVACGPGHIGAQIRERGNYVVGTEISESAAAKARQVLDEVRVLDLESPWPDALRAKPFDVVLLGEILEHVFDPVVVLKEARSVLSPHGKIVVTTPNFLLWIARLQILFGRFRYQKYGLWDFGHIRFFTYDYLRQVLAEAGFRVERERHIAHPERLTPLVGRWPSLFAMYFVVVARKIEDHALG
jgi:SAM-dependent methyltransferase